jgi:hypothetical protein
VFRVDGLESGTYALRYLNGNEIKSIRITVSDGDVWPENNSFIMRKYEMIERAKNQRIMRLSKFNIEDASTSDNTHKVQVEVSNCLAGVHMALSATTFLSNFSDFYALIAKYQNMSLSASVFNFAKWKNIYQSNAIMSDELRYVNDRKKLEAQLGNSLDRPSLLMQR